MGTREDCLHLAHPLSALELRGMNELAGDDKPRRSSNAKST